MSKKRPQTFDELRESLRPGKRIIKKGTEAWPRDGDFCYIVEKTDDKWGIVHRNYTAITKKKYSTQEDAVNDLPRIADEYYARTPLMQLLDVLEARFDRLERMIEFQPGNTGALAAEAHFSREAHDFLINDSLPSKRSRNT